MLSRHVLLWMLLASVDEPPVDYEGSVSFGFGRRWNGFCRTEKFGRFDQPRKRNIANHNSKTRVDWQSGWQPTLVLLLWFAMFLFLGWYPVNFTSSLTGHLWFAWFATKCDIYVEWGFFDSLGFSPRMSCTLRPRMSKGTLYSIFHCFGMRWSLIIWIVLLWISPCHVLRLVSNLGKLQCIWDVPIHSPLVLQGSKKAPSWL